MTRVIHNLCAVVFAGAISHLPAQAMTVEDLQAGGYAEMHCTFKQRCVINLPCETAWRDHRWFLNDTEGYAYRVFRSGRISRKGQLMIDQRWKETSEARAILMPMREAVASHLTVFDGGGAIYSLQYAANPGSGQFFWANARRCSPKPATKRVEVALSLQHNKVKHQIAWIF